MNKKSLLRIDVDNPSELVLHRSSVKINFTELRKFLTYKASLNKRSDPWLFLDEILKLKHGHSRQMMAKTEVSLLHLRYVCNILDVDINTFIDFGGFYYMISK